MAGGNLSRDQPGPKTGLVANSGLSLLLNPGTTYNGSLQLMREALLALLFVAQRNTDRIDMLIDGQLGPGRTIQSNPERSRPGVP
jgi:hypothetical protein